jgi:hypothetical protein
LAKWDQVQGELHYEGDMRATDDLKVAFNIVKDRAGSGAWQYVDYGHQLTEENVEQCLILG